MTKVMYLVALAVPAIVEKALRYPVENPLTVDLDEAKRLYDAGVLEGEPEEIAEASEGEDDGLDKLKVADLDAIIAEEGVEVDPSANKAAKVAAIREARAAL